MIKRTLFQKASPKAMQTFRGRFAYAILAVLTLFIIAPSSQTQAESFELSESVEADSDNAASLMLPVGQKVFKVLVSEEGIYEISASDLIAKGMSNNLDPANIQLMQYGEAVAWELVSDPTGNPNLFDKNDKIRFYGWPFGADESNESRAEKLYVNENVFWIIPGRPASTVQAGAGAPASTPVITSVVDHQRFEYDDLFSGLQLTDTLWELEGAEPDHYFWLPLRRGEGDDLVNNVLSVQLDHPTSTTSPATISAVSGARQESNTPGKAGMTLPDNSTVEYDFTNGDVFTLTQTIPNNLLSNGANTISFSHARLNPSDSAGSYYVNYVDVAYHRELKGVENRLAFSSTGNGNQTFELSAFTASSASDLVIWNVTDRKAPQRLEASAAGGGSYRFNHSVGSSADFMVASKAGIQPLTGDAISAYTPPNLDPAGGYADWLAIAHGDFINIPGTTNDIAGLAAYRNSASNLETQVVNIADVINQYGYGFASSHAVKRYVTHAYEDWSQPVRYLLLGGDGHFNPRHLACSECNIRGTDFQTSLDSLIPVYHSYSDRFQGLIPSDFRYTLLTGDDLIPEIAIGRLSAENVDQLQDAVSKILAYENNLVADSTWQENMLFTHDWPLGVEDNKFRVDSEEAEKKVESYGFKASVAGLHTNPGDPNAQTVSDLRQEISSAAVNGLSLLAWRGHGSLSSWSNGEVISVDRVLNNQLFPNIDKPFVSITHNCLDGNFAYPGLNGLGESLLRIGEKSQGSPIYRNTGSAGHFGSTGLGFADEHEIIGDHLFEALFEKGITRFGDAINYAKIESAQLVSISELYSFNYLGDPAMVLFKTDSGDYTSSVSPVELEPEDLATATIEIFNNSDFTASAETQFTFTLPKDLEYKTTFIDYTGPNASEFNNPTNPTLEPVTISSKLDGQGNTVITVIFNKETVPGRVGGIPANGSVRIRIFANAKPEITQSYWIASFSLISPGNEPQSGGVTYNFGGGRFVYLPIILKN